MDITIRLSEQQAFRRNSQLEQWAVGAMCFHSKGLSPSHGPLCRAKRLGARLFGSVMWFRILSKPHLLAIFNLLVSVPLQIHTTTHYTPLTYIPCIHLHIHPIHISLTYIPHIHPVHTFPHIHPTHKSYTYIPHICPTHKSHTYIRHTYPTYISYTYILCIHPT